MTNVKGLPQLRSRLRAIGNTEVVLRDLQLKTIAEAKALVPRKTGHLGRNIVAGPINDKTAVVTARTSYARYVEEGTGLYGPRHKRIVPKKARVLAWRTGGKGSVRLSGRSRTRGGVQLAGWAFAQSVSGRKATPYLIPGAKRAVGKSKDVIVEQWNDAA